VLLVLAAYNCYVDKKKKLLLFLTFTSSLRPKKYQFYSLLLRQNVVAN
jgi:hypothetical protein